MYLAVFCYLGENMVIKAGIYGATGYSGLELIKLLSNHPNVNIVFATSRTHGGTTLDKIHPDAPNLLLQHTSDINIEDADVIFLCLPHTSGM